MASTRQKRVSEEIRKFAGNFIAENGNRLSMITPTMVTVSPDLKQTTIYVSVFPLDHEDSALHFLRRKRNDFRTYIKKHGHTKVLPFVDFEIDQGEKNRQLIDEIAYNADMGEGKRVADEDETGEEN